MPPKKRVPGAPYFPKTGRKTNPYPIAAPGLHNEKPTPRASLPAHRKTISTHLTAKNRCPLKKVKIPCTPAKHSYPVATRRSPHRKTIFTLPAPRPAYPPPLQNSPLKSKKYAPPQMRQGRNLSIGSLCSRFEDYFLAFGARIIFIFLPSSLGISSTLANSSKSVAKRSSRISPCSLKTIERPRKNT